MIYTLKHATATQGHWWGHEWVSNGLLMVVLRSTRLWCAIGGFCISCSLVGLVHRAIIGATSGLTDGPPTFDV